jgi:hypothetical protein
MEKTKENFRWERPKRNEMKDLGEIQLISKRGPIHFFKFRVIFNSQVITSPTKIKYLIESNDFELG